MIIASGKRLAFWQWRFSLRALFIVITVLAVSLGWKLHLLREQQRVIRELQAARGDMAAGSSILVFYAEPKWPWINHFFDEHFLDPVTVIYIDRLTDSEARQLCHLRHLKKLTIKSDLLTDEGICALRDLKSLCDLYVQTTQVTSDSTRKLGLALPHTKILWYDGDDLFGPIVEICGANVSKDDKPLLGRPPLP